MAAADTTGKIRRKPKTSASSNPIGGLDRILCLRWPPDDQLRARDVVSRSRAKPTGLYPSWKADRMLEWESPHERNAFVLLDADPEVKAFTEQPVVIDYVLDGVAHKHYPDILVEYLSGPREFWEVKTRAEAADPQVNARTSLMRDRLPELGFKYRIYAAEELAIQPRLGNARTIIRHGRKPLDPITREQVRQLIAAAGRIPWALADDEEFGKRGRQAMCSLVLEGELTFDFTGKITGNTHFVPGRATLGVR